MENVYTDLAVEAREIYAQTNNSKTDGVEFKEFKYGDINVSQVEVVDDTGEKRMGKPKGTYITIDMPDFTHYDGDTMDKVSKAMAQAMSNVIRIQDSMTALVVGLGNSSVTPDALGPRVISKLMITRHLKEFVPDSIDEGIRPVCAVAPGVLGTTGIETGEIIKGIVEKIKPDIIICIDALASRKMERVNRTIQIGNTGISPGSGVGNKRMELSKKTLGVPVIAIGVPTVVDAATMANDTIDMVLDEMIRNASQGSKFYDILKSVNKDEKAKMIREVLNPYIGNLVVTPKEVDTVIESLSRIIANGINISLQPALDLDDINKFLN
ncbi:GPR endopeptidase [Clostridium oryzae]|uniref:Germination protease n=1 Tax=Clostridium oryzae TaxID=1450648 RepID=A0A1V4IVL6_9CLOT|nr:GPR endopeptidase [Clostridium oryzae]OPJ63835.1 germination protease precursor [Clostridium oryzae]